MVDDLGFDLGFDAIGFDAAGFDAFSELGDFDPTSSLAGGFGLDDAGMETLAGLELDLDFDLAGIGSGSDLEDVVFAADAAEIVDLGFGSDAPDVLDLSSVLELAPDELAGMDPVDALGASSLPSPFLPEDLGGAGVIITGGAAGAVPYGLGTPTTDSFVLRPSSKAAGRLAAKLGAKGVALGRDVMRDAGRGVIGDAVYDEVKERVRDGAKSIFLILRNVAAARNATEDHAEA